MLEMNSRNLQRRCRTTNWEGLAVLSDELRETLRVRQLDGILRLYLEPMLAHLIFARGIPVHQAEDFLHGFIEHKILKKNILAKADRTRGKFRTFLLTALDKYVINQYRRQNLRDQAVLASAPDPKDLQNKPEVFKAFDLSWVGRIIQETLVRVEAVCRRTGRKRFWVLFDEHFLGPILRGTTPTPYAELVERLGFSSPTQAANAVLSVKRVFLRTFREVMGEYAEDGADAEEETRKFFAVLADLDR